MLDKIFCEKVLKIEAPWHITKVTIDQEKQRIDIWLEFSETKKKLWFSNGGSFKANKKDNNMVEGIWQHLGLGDCRTFIHAAVPENSEVSLASWAGQADLPFSRALSRRILELLSERLSYRSICALLNVDLQDVWATKLSIDKGELRLSDSDHDSFLERKESADTDTPLPETDVTELDFEANESPKLNTFKTPALEHPVWQQMLNEEIEVSIRQLGLKLLVSRLRTQLSNTNDDEIRMLRMNELRKYFKKHERFLQHELGQMLQK